MSVKIEGEHDEASTCPFDLEADSHFSLRTVAAMCNTMVGAGLSLVAVLGLSMLMLSLCPDDVSMVRFYLVTLPKSARAIFAMQLPRMHNNTVTMVSAPYACCFKYCHTFDMASFSPSVPLPRHPRSSFGNAGPGSSWSWL